MKNKSMDMTQGSALKLLLFFTLPALAGNLLNQVYSITDSVIVGQFLGQTSLAAIGVCMPVVLLTSSMVIGVNIGVGILMSQARGRGDIPGMRHVLANSLYMAAAVSLVTAVLGIPLTYPILHLMGTPAGPLKEAASYMTISFAATIFPMLYFLSSNIFRGMGDSMTALYCLIVSVFTNVILDIVFVANLHLGVAGTAFATAIAQCLSVIFAFVMLYKKYPEMRMTREDARMDFPLLKKITGLALPIALQSGFNNMGNIVVQSCINGFGEAVMAAYTAASRLGTLSLMPAETLGGSLSIYSGQNYGAGKTKRIHEGVRAAWVLNAIISIALGMVLVVAGKPMTKLFLPNPSQEVLTTAYRYLLIAAVPGVLNGIMCIYQQTLRGIGKANESVIGGFMQLGAKVAAALIGAVLLHSLDAVWLAWPVSFIAGTIFPYIVYRKTLREMLTSEE